MLQASPLLSLPAELRNQIYREALVLNNNISIDPEEIHRHVRFLHVCRQIRQEAEKMFWTENTFYTAVMDGIHSGPVKERLAMIGPERVGLITKFCIGHEVSKGFDEDIKGSVSDPIPVNTQLVLELMYPKEFTYDWLCISELGVRKEFIYFSRAPCDHAMALVHERVSAALHQTFTLKMEEMLGLAPSNSAERIRDLLPPNIWIVYEEEGKMEREFGVDD